MLGILIHVTFNGRYKWVFDGERFAAVASDTMSHGELAEQELGRPGAGADQIDRGLLSLVDDAVRYEVYFSAGREPDVEAAIRRWVAQLIGHPASSVDGAPSGWEFE